MASRKNETVKKKLEIDGKYKGFSDFYDENKILIYKNIIDLFASFKDKTKNKLVLTISATIKGFDWETDMRFNRKDMIVLIRDIIPYFENIEDYETCNEIKILYGEITQ